MLGVSQLGKVGEWEHYRVVGVSGEHIADIFYSNHDEERAILNHSVNTVSYVDGMPCPELGTELTDIEKIFLYKCPALPSKIREAFGVSRKKDVHPD